MSVINPEWSRVLAWPRRRWQDNTEMDQIELKDIKFIFMAKDRNQRQASVCQITHIGFRQMMWNCGWASSRIRRSALCHGLFRGYFVS